MEAEVWKAYLSGADRPATIGGTPEGVIRHEGWKEPAGWSTYENPKRALRFKYPAEWTVQEFVYDASQQPPRNQERFHLSFLAPNAHDVMGVSIFQNVWSSPETFLAELNAGAPTPEQARFPFAKITKTTIVNGNRVVIFEWENLMTGPLYSAALAQEGWLHIFHMWPDAAGSPLPKGLETLTTILSSLPPPASTYRIVFEAKSATGEELFSMKADGTDLRQITHGPGLNQEAACSPDGARIAFTSWRDNTHYLYLINADGSQERRLAGGPGNVAEPAWSPDGRQVAFNSEADKAFYLINADGSSQVKLPISGANIFSPVWSPDGRRLTYVSDSGQAADLHIARLDGTDDVNLTAGKGFAYQPAWSPDGRQIAFCGILDGGNTYNIYVMNADGSNVRRLTTSQDDGDRQNSFRPAWSPDGKQIAFHRDQGGGYDIWIMKADGSEQRQLTNGLNASNPCWLPAR